MRRAVRNIHGCWSVALGILLSVGAAQAQQSKQGEASKMFRLCRAIEKNGDATACWKTWLDEHREYGHEAEVMVAEERASRGQLDSEPAQQPAAEMEAQSRSDESESQPEPEVAEDAADAAETGPAPAAVVELIPGAVLDFCQLKPDLNSEKFTKKRAVFFNLAGVEALGADLPGTDAAGQVARTFSGKLPLERMHNVVTTVPSPKGTSERKEYGLAEFVSALQLSGEGLTEQDESEREFVRYSLGCTDYVLTSELLEHEVKWVDQEIVLKDGSKRTVQVLDLHMTVATTVFERQGTGFVQIAVIKKKVPTALSVASDMSAQTAANMEATVSNNMASVGLSGSVDVGVAILQSHISAIPRGCPIPGVGSDGSSLGCSLEGQASSWLKLSEVSERFSQECQLAAQTHDPKDSVVCEARVRADYLVLAIQTAMRKVKGWKLFAPLAYNVPNKPNTPGLALGKNEGVKVGWGFEVMRSGQRVGYLKVTKVGPGGEPGETNPSRLNLRAGKAPDGARLSEFPMLGITVTPAAGLLLLMQNDGAFALQEVPGFFAVYRLPSLVYGGGVDVGFDLSSVLGWSETYLRTGWSLYGANGSSTQVTLMPIDVAFEKGFYMGPRLVVYGVFGASMSLITVETFVTSVGGAAQNLSASVFGLHGAMGLDLMLTPRLSLRGEGLIRPSLSKAKYQEVDDLPIALDFDTRDDRFGNLGFRIGARLTF